MQYIEKAGSYSFFLIFMVVLGWFALFFLAPAASSADIASGWEWWLTRVAGHWKLVIVGCIALGTFAGVMDTLEEGKE